MTYVNPIVVGLVFVLASLVLVYEPVTQSCILLPRESKKQDTKFLPVTSANVDRFSDSFTFGLSSDCVTY